MRVLVTGAYGLLGSAIVERLVRDGHTIVGHGRSVSEARRRYPEVTWVEADFSKLTSAAQWRPLLAGIDAVVNCVGAFQQGARDDLQAVHVGAPLALFEACTQHGPSRIIQVSAIGAALDGPSAFATTKGLADAALAASTLNALILRPGVVIALNVYGATAMLRGLAGLPLVIPMFAPDSEIQVVGVEEVAATVAWALRCEPAPRGTFDLVHPSAVQLREVASMQRRWLGFSPARVVRLPDWSVRAIAFAADALGWLGWRSPVRSTAVRQLVAGIRGDPQGWMETTGIKPRSYAELLRERPATLPDRWFARLYFLKPLALAALAAFWIATGAFSLGPGYERGLAYLKAADVGPRLAAAIVVLGALLDLVLGAALLVRRFTRTVLIAMLVITPVYLLFGTILAPQLWTDPLGAFTKTVVVMLATAFTLAILDER